MEIIELDSDSDGMEILPNHKPRTKTENLVKNKLKNEPDFKVEMKNENGQENYYLNVNNQKSIYVEEYDKVLVKVEEKVKEELVKGEHGFKKEADDEKKDLIIGNLKDESKYIITKWEKKTLTTSYPLDLYQLTFDFLQRNMLMYKGRLLNRYSNRIICHHKFAVLQDTVINL